VAECVSVLRPLAPCQFRAPGGRAPVCRDERRSPKIGQM
jgi:hypothetical protein